MTLLDIRNQIISVLCDKSTFERADFALVKVTKPLESVKEMMILEVLKQITEINLIKKLSDDVWILNHPINSSGQEIKLSMSTCSYVAETINTFLKAQGDEETPRADVLNLHEMHILMLLEILDTVLNTDPESGQETGDEEK